MSERFDYLRVKGKLVEARRDCKRLRKAAERANELVDEEKTELGTICFVVLKELDKILAAAKEIKKVRSRSTRTDFNTDRILKKVGEIQKRLHEVHNE